MKYCRRCGNQIDDNAIFCPRCGDRVNGDASSTGYGMGGGFYSPYAVNLDMKESFAVAALSFLFWQIGIVMWLCWRNTRPGKARSASKGMLSMACFSFPVVGLVCYLLWRKTDRRDFARIAAVSAIVGIALYVASVALFGILRAMGVEYFVRFAEQLPALMPDGGIGA